MDMRKRVIPRLWRCAVANAMYLTAPEKTKKAIDEDVRGYIGQDDITYNGSLLKLDCVLLSGEKNFRNVFYYRFVWNGKLCSLSRVFLPHVKAVEIYGNIGGGLRLYHDHLIAHVCSAGKNLHIGPGVILGKNRGEFPTFGDNVVIEANAVVIGGLKIGDNSVIKAGSVVTKDLEGNAVYAGSPARLVKSSETKHNTGS